MITNAILINNIYIPESVPKNDRRYIVDSIPNNIHWFEANYFLRGSLKENEWQGNILFSMVSN